MQNACKMVVLGDLFTHLAKLGEVYTPLRYPIPYPFRFQGGEKPCKKPGARH